MINAFDPKRVVGLVTLLALVMFAGSMLALQMIAPLPEDANPWARLWEAARLAIFLVNALLLLMTWSPFLWLIHTATFAKYWWFPWLGGDWHGEVKSNWPRVEAMMDAARDKRAPFDTATDDVDPLTVKFRARIKCGLLAIRIHFEIDDTERTSDTIFVRPERKPGEEPAIYYVYRQNDQGTPAVTDTREHLGAAILRLNEKVELKGKYWTARNEERGLTTAGTIALKRVRRRKPPKKKKTSA